MDGEKEKGWLRKEEGLDEEEKLILQTAVLYHDTGYIANHLDNEEFAINLAKVNSRDAINFDKRESLTRGASVSIQN